MTSNDLLTRRVAKVLPDAKGLEKLLNTRKIRLYQGFDPTSNRLHLGHTIGLRKLMEFAKAGHEVIFLFGTGTVLAGDPSERETGRKLITQEEIEANIASWKKQTSAIVDFDLIKIKENGDWLTKLRLKDIIHIASNISATQLFKRESFTRRIAKGDPVWYHETMYPLLQGYDSVVMDVDLEIGGTDQEFNMLVGRELQRKINNREKYVLTTPMIVGTDGKQMSKSSGNCIFLQDSADEMYTKLMGISDDLIPLYFELLTDREQSFISSLDPNDPLSNKTTLALDITTDFHGTKAAKEAAAKFENFTRQKQAPSDAPLVTIKSGTTILDLLKQADLAVSNSSLKRTIEQGGVTINGDKIIDPSAQAYSGDLKFGRSSYRKVKVED